jgi:3-deoxy-D-arabino-heptulosonate 7-phosphate (DAHP) synthase|tara:strand:- start:356 stop:688 length:333 start_codon:yes stop_codon:yes gene_type:complete
MAKKQDGEARRVHFYANKDAHIRFRASLEKHNMTMSEFFRACCDAITEDDKTMLSFVDSYKEASDKHSKKNTKITKKSQEIGDSILSDLGIGEDDIESLFDFIAEQHPEI